MAGQRTRIRFGAVSAEVLLEKTATKPRGAQHETRRVLVEVVPPGEGDAQTEAYRELTGAPEVRSMRVETTDPFGDPVTAPGPVDVSAAAHAVGQRGGAQPTEVHEDEVTHFPAGLLGPMGDPTWPGEQHAPEADEGPTGDDAPETSFDVPDPAEPWDGTNPPARGVAFDSAEHEPQRQSVATPEPTPRPGDFTTEEREGLNPAAPTYVPPATRVEQGVHLEDGTWVDLTDRLAEVDTRTRVDGLEVVRTIPASSYASERVRDAHYVAGVDPDTYKTLALLWRALRAEGRAAEVRWTKRTAQASGIIVARGELPSADRPRPAVPAHLLLLELEWAANVKRIPPRVFGPVRAEVAVDEVAAAIELVQSFAAPAPRVELRDERLAKRAELLELARAGKLAEYEPPAEPMPETFDQGAEDLAAALALSAAWVREHAPA